MYHLSLTLETPAANVALDQLLLESAESGELEGDVLRLWESPEHCVVLGRSSRESEVRHEVCEESGVPILRRSSGGGGVAIGPGCLMYALVLDLTRRPQLRAIDQAHRFVLNAMIDALAPLAAGVACAGTSDLAFTPTAGEPPRKFSGNSLRIKRRHLLYHGTILYDFDVPSLARWLGPPTREPAYRRSRTHQEFVANLPVRKEELVAALINGWQALEPLEAGLTHRLKELVECRRPDPPN